MGGKTAPAGSVHGRSWWIDEREVSLWLQAWGSDRECLPALEAQWLELLERLFPDGKTL